MIVINVVKKIIILFSRRHLHNMYKSVGNVIWLLHIPFYIMNFFQIGKSFMPWLKHFFNRNLFYSNRPKSSSSHGTPSKHIFGARGKTDATLHLFKIGCQFLKLFKAIEMCPSTITSIVGSDLLQPIDRKCSELVVFRTFRRISGSFRNDWWSPHGN